MSRTPFLSAVALTAALAVLFGWPGAEAAEDEAVGAPTCAEFYDKWEVAGLPPAMLAMAGIGRELMAAQDCVDKGDSANACRHWRKVIEVADKLGPPFDKDRGGIEQQMREHNCGDVPPAAEPESAPGPADGTDAEE